MTGLLSVAGSTPSDEGFELKSLRFDHASNPYLKIADTGPSTNTRVGTISFWWKPTKLATNQILFYGGTNTSNLTYCGPRADDMFDIYDQAGGGLNFVTRTDDLFRDPAAWYHMVFEIDTTRAIASTKITNLD